MKLKNRLLAALLGLSLLLCSCAENSSAGNSSDSSSPVTSQTTTTTQTTTQSTQQTTTTSAQTSTVTTQDTSESGKLTQTSPQQPSDKVQGVPMWEGTAPNGNKITFLGSMHAARDNFYPLPEKIRKAYEQAEIIAVECDTENAVDESLQFELQQKMSYSDGTLLKDKLSPEAYKVMCDQLTELGSSAETLSNYRPWAAYEMISTLMILSSDIKIANGVDYYFMRQSKTDGKQLYELESYQTQVDMLTNEPDQLYDALFRLSKNQTKQSYLDETTQLYEAWLKGDLEQIEALSVLPSDEELKKEGMSDEDIRLLKNRNKVQLDDRNVVMANRIKELFTQGKKTFVTVGIGHYIGDKGLISLLQKQGYTFRRI